MQAASGSKQSVSKYTGIKQALKLIVKEEGIQVQSCLKILETPLLTLKDSQ